MNEGGREKERSRDGRRETERRREKEREEGEIRGGWERGVGEKENGRDIKNISCT